MAPTAPPTQVPCEISPPSSVTKLPSSDGHFLNAGNEMQINRMGIKELWQSQLAKHIRKDDSPNSEGEL